MKKFQRLLALLLLAAMVSSIFVSPVLGVITDGEPQETEVTSSYENNPTDAENNDNQPEKNVQPNPDSQPEGQPAPDSEVQPEDKSKDKSKEQSEDKAEDKTEAKTEIKPVPVLVCTLPQHTHVKECYKDETIAEAEDKAESKSEDKAESKSEDKTESKSEDKAEDKTEDEAGDENIICGLEEHTHLDACYDLRVCGLDEHAHTEECYEDDVLVCTLPEHTHKEECYQHYSTISDEASGISLTGFLPKDAVLSVTVPEAEELEKLCPEGQEFDFAYDISILVNEYELQPYNALLVTILSDAADAEKPVLHFSDDGSSEELEATEIEGGISFYAGSFSVFAQTSPITPKPQLSLAAPMLQSPVLSNETYVGEITGIQTEQNQRYGTLEYPWADMQTAYANVADGGTIYVVGNLSVDQNHPWPTEAKNVTIKGIPATTYYDVQLSPQITFSSDVVLTGATTFCGHLSDSAVLTPLTLGGSMNIYPEGNVLTMGTLDADDNPLNDIAVSGAKINTSLKNTANNSAAGGLELHLYGNTAYSMAFDSSTVCYQNGILIDCIGARLNCANSTGYYSNGAGILPALMTGTGNVELRLRNAKGNISLFSSTQALASDATVNITDSSMGTFMPCASNYNCNSFTYNINNSTLSNIYLKGYSFDGRFNLDRSVQTSAQPVSFNLTDSSVTSALYCATAKASPSSADPSVILNLNGAVTLGALGSHTTDFWQINVLTGSASIGTQNFLTYDLNLADNLPLTLGSQHRYTFIHDITLGNASQLTLKGAEYRLTGNLTGGFDQDALVTLPKRFDLGIKGSFKNNITLNIEGVSNQPATTGVLVNIGAGDLEGYVTYAGNLGSENLVALTGAESLTYITAASVPLNMNDAVYLRYSGSDNNSGLSYGDAVATTKKAYEVARQTGRNTIVVCGLVSYYFDTTNYYTTDWNVFAGSLNAGDIKITSLHGTDYRGGLFAAELRAPSYSGGYRAMSIAHAYDASSVTTIENLNVTLYQADNCYTYNYLYFTCNGNTTVIGDGVTVPYETQLFGGAYYADLSHGTNLTVKSGTYATIYGGSLCAYNNYKTVNGDIKLNVMGAQLHGSKDYNGSFNIYGSVYETVTGNVNVKVGGTAGYSVTGISGIIGIHTGTHYGNLLLEADGTGNTLSFVFSDTYGTSVVGRIGGSLIGTMTLRVRELSGHNNFAIVGGANGSVEINNVDLLHSVMGYYNGNQPNYALNITVENDDATTVFKGGIYCGSGDLIYPSGTGGNVFVADTVGDASTSTMNASCTVTLRNVETAAICGGNNGYSYAIGTKLINRTLSMSGNCVVTNSIRQFNNFTTATGSSLLFNGAQLETGMWENSGMAEFSVLASVVGDYTGNPGSVISPANQPLTMTGKILGSSALTPSILSAGCSIISTMYDTATSTTVPQGQSAFTALNIQFDNSTPAGGATWIVLPQTHDPIPNVFVRNRLATEPLPDDPAYISDHDGSSYEKALYTLTEAFYTVDTTSGQGNIIVCGALDQANSWDAVHNDNTVLITSRYVDAGGLVYDYRQPNAGFEDPSSIPAGFDNGTNAATMTLTGANSGYITMYGNWTLQNLTVKYQTSDYLGIDANGYTLIVGTDICPDILVDKEFGAYRLDSDGVTKISVQAPVASVPADVTFAPVSGGNPTKFVLIGGGKRNENSTMPQIDMRLYNTTVGQVIGINQNTTVAGDFNMVVRDTNVLWTDYDGVKSASLCTTPGTSNTIKGSTAHINGDANVYLEWYSRTGAGLSLTHTYNVFADGSGLLARVNKTESRFRFSGCSRAFYVKCEADMYYLYDSLDDTRWGFDINYFLPDLSYVTPNNVYMIVLGGFKSLGSGAANEDGQLNYSWCDKRNLSGASASNTNFKVIYGSATRGSFANAGSVMFSITGSPWNNSKNVPVFKSYEIHVYPGTTISNSTSNITLDNHTYSPYVQEIYAAKDLTHGYPMIMFHSTDAELAAGTPHEYNISKLRKFAIGADGCTVKLNDSSYICTGMEAVNNGVIDLGGKALNVTKRSGFGGYATLRDGGQIINLPESLPNLVAGCMTVDNATLTAEVEKISFGSYYSSGNNANIIVAPNTRVNIGYLQDSCGTTVVDYQPDTIPEPSDPGATVYVSTQGDLARGLFVAGKNMEGTGENLNTLGYSTTGSSMVTRLPSAYQEVEYLEGNGSQYIDLRYVPIGSETFDIIFESVSFATYTQLFGTRIGAVHTSNTNCWLGLDNSGLLYHRFGTVLIPSNIYLTQGTHHITVDMPNTTTNIDGQNYYFQGSSISEIYLSLYLGYLNTNYTLPNGGTTRYNEFSVKNVQDNVMSLVPCYRISDSKPGMYDLVTGEFFVNQGSGDDFIVGPDTTTLVSGGTTTWKIGAGAGGDKYKIYIKDEGVDTNTGGIASEAVQTLGRAFEAAYQRYNGLVTGESADALNLDASERTSHPTFYINVCGTFTLQDLAEAYSAYYTHPDYDVVLTSGTRTVKITASSVDLPADFTMQDIRLSATGSTELFAHGHSLTIGEDVRTNNSSTTTGTHISLYGGGDDDTVSSTNLVVHSGSWFRVYGGGKTGSVTGDVNLTLEDTSVEKTATSRLPNGYIEVEYLESHKKEYIDTGYYPNENTAVQTVFCASPYNSEKGLGDGTTFVFGGGVDAVTNNLELYDWNGKWELNRYGCVFSIPAYSGHICEFFQDPEAPSTVIISDRTNGNSQSWTKNTRFTSPYRMALFAIGRKNISCSKNSIRIYSFKIFESGEPVRDFVPCINPDGEYGMYDLVTEQFFGNAGSGAFTGGEEVFNEGTNVSTYRYPLTITGAQTDVVNDIAGVFGGGKEGTVTGNININVSGGENYGNIYGGGCNTSAEVTGNININIENGSENDTVIDRVYGGGCQAPTTGNTEITMTSGTAKRVYGGGQLSDSEVGGTTEVNIGAGSGATDTAKVTDYLRGSGALSGVGTKSVLNINEGAYLPGASGDSAGCNVAGGGYTGTALRSELHITGGDIDCDVYAGSAGEYANGGADTTAINPNLGKVGSTGLTVTGGDISGNVFAGGNKGYVGTGIHANTDVSTVEISGGTVSGNIYGGCSVATSYGNVDVKLSGGTVSGKIFGGGLGTDNLAAAVTGSSTTTISGGTLTGSVYGGGDCNGTVATAKIYADATPGGSVFGGGYGEKTSVDNTIVNLNATGTTPTKVYGGGELGTVGDASVTAVQWNGDIFGGGKGKVEDSVLTDAATKKTTVTVDGSVTGNVYGGGELASVQDADGTGVTVKSGASVTGNVFGGGKGAEGTDYAAVTKTFVDVKAGGTVTGNVYGGGELAYVAAEGTTGIVSKVDIYGDVTGTIYGGGKGSANNAAQAAINGSTQVNINSDCTTVFGGGEIAPVNGGTQVNVNSGTVGSVFGGNDVSGSINGSTDVNIDGGVITNVYGGGNLAAYSGAGTDVDITGGAVQNAYGGGYGAGATVDNASLEISGGAVTNAYGGGNLASTVNASVEVTDGTVTTVYGGGNLASVTGTAKVDINTQDSKKVDTVYLGNNKAAMAIQPELDINFSVIDTLYLGGNEGIMTKEGGLSYTFDYPSAQVTNLYAGCNNTGTGNYTADVNLTLESGSYETVYGGNNSSGAMANTHVNVSEDPAGALVLTTVYGGGNLAASNNTSVVVSNYADKASNAITVYGGGNQAQTANAEVSVTGGEVDFVYGGGNKGTTGTASLGITGGDVDFAYGGGNAATVTDSVNINVDGTGVKVANLYCGNNQASMDIAPAVTLDDADITNFYGGGNMGIMTCPYGLVYTFDSADLDIDNIYGGGYAAGVDSSVTLNMKKGSFNTVYGGSYDAGTVGESTVNVYCDIPGNIYGGGRGSATVVTETNVNVFKGIIGTYADDTDGNIFGGSGFGKVGTSNVTLRDSGEGSGQIIVLGNVYGAGYGTSSHTGTANVTVDLKLNIATKNSVASSNVFSTADADVIVYEVARDVTDTSGESKARAEWTHGDYSTAGVSYLAKSVFGGGDMGQVGDGSIQGNNTANILSSGSTNVVINSGYIHGSVFGGGNGEPEGTDENGVANTYNAYMGDVFGQCNVTVKGGYIKNNVFGCGQQSKTYASADNASVVTVSSTVANPAEGKPDQKPVVIGGSVFGGGNKGNSLSINASVPTVYGNTNVNFTSPEGEYSHIYLLSDGTTGGGVYGDGNLCLVQGTRTINLENFSCGLADANRLKTFYSLQRANVANLTASRVVLRGAVDLVADNPTDAQFSVNRVGQINMNESSTIKVCKTVNLLGGLKSDLLTEREFIHLGKNSGNAGNVDEYLDNGYTGHGATASDPATPITQEEVAVYHQAYETYISGADLSAGSYNLTDKNGSLNSAPIDSVNMVCVANGSYLEVKKTATSFGPVEGLFTLQLLKANPGEGGGFVYADIPASTGNFVCVTKMDLKEGQTTADYMYVYHNVGGNFTDPKYEYYYWYLKGGRYSYDVNLEGEIGTTDTVFTETISLSVENNMYYVLSSLTAEDPVKENFLMTQTGTAANETRLQNIWDTGYADEEKLSLEIVMEVNEKSVSGITVRTESLGYIGYQTADGTPAGTALKTSEDKYTWGIWHNTGTEASPVWVFIPSRSGTNLSFNKDDMVPLAFLDENCTGIRITYKLYKGLGIVDEFKDVPFKFIMAQADKTSYEASSYVNSTSWINDDSCTKVTTNLNVSVVRVIPTQEAFISSGRLYAGFSSTEFNITGESGFSAQFITKYVPSAFNSVNGRSLDLGITTEFDNVYLRIDSDDGMNGTGITVKGTPETDADGEYYPVVNVTNCDDTLRSHYRVTKTDNVFSVSYNNHQADWTGVATDKTLKDSFSIPRHTLISLVMKMDEGSPSYWYYYCTADKTTDVPLTSFCAMNSTLDALNATNNANVAAASVSSTRISEDLSFIFDFSRVTAQDWLDAGYPAGTTGGDEIEGSILLKHTFTTDSGEKYDIMDFVKKTTTENNNEGTITTTVDYSHEAPHPAEFFKVKRAQNNVVGFEIQNVVEGVPTTNDADYLEKDTMKFQISISENGAVHNTVYEEGEFAVNLTLTDGAGNPVQFPEGTEAVFNGKTLSFGKDNMFLVVPVKTFGIHNVALTNLLDDYETGAYTLTATLYSTDAEGYYNSVLVHDVSASSAGFTVANAPVYALRVDETRGEAVRNRLVHAGDSLNFLVTAYTDGANDADIATEVGISLYKLASGCYQPCTLADILSGSSSVNAQGKLSWNPQILEGTANGTYRLAFTYKDKTEYWDFIVY